MALNFMATFRNRHFHSFLGNLVTAFFNVLSFALLVRVLSIPDFGEWVLFIATYNILDQIRTGLLQSGIIKFYAGVEMPTAKKVIGAAWYISLILTLSYVVLGALVYFVAYEKFNDTWHFFLQWIGIVALLSLPWNFATWVLQAEHRFDNIVKIRLVQNGSFLVFLGALYLSHTLTIQSVLYAFAASMALASIYSLLAKWTGVRSLAFKTKEHGMELFRFGRLVVGSMVSSSLISYSDNLVIRTMMNPAAVAIYSIPQKFMEVIEIILRSFVATAQPTLSAAANRKDYAAVARAFCRYTGTVSILIIPFILGLIILTKPLIIILADKAYLGATDVVRIFLFSAILWPIDRFIGVTLDMINKPAVNLYKNILKLVLNVACDLLFVYFFNDIRSVAFSSLLNVVFAAAFGYYFIKKYLKVSIREICVYGWQECITLINKLRNKHYAAE
ncbi:O-antigen/teichoic acid export membrane protein [Chitinophaga terrae (ex Kim and Jung 2007)]|uniref:lipopolysaccharide biosynthesis protein n=1 Tax=Chitinophaga terrae (ex Kim and Jung 2007) TaxID=408074 RepID=UPI00277F639C|nr:oligosaccharide flippase family protein [Chitinophaga terrae (ex Kim and Jung 2007)]MDQ0109373.1 O-antigen/teichoic acid export membrane protein [Chitinophaga terrae (ex Kim and Jung 2007)]